MAAGVCICYHTAHVAASMTSIIGGRKNTLELSYAIYTRRTLAKLLNCHPDPRENLC